MFMPSGCGLTNHGDHLLLQPLRGSHGVCESGGELLAALAALGRGNTSKASGVRPANPGGGFG
eukprot:100543-Pyramimonas_sp.AAC.1